MTTNFKNPLELFSLYFDHIFSLQIDVFIGAAMLVLSIHGFMIIFIVKKYLLYLYSSSGSWSFRTGFIPFTLATQFILLTHLLDLLYFSYLMDGMGVFSDPLTAFYFTGEMYSTLGYGSYDLAPEWRGLPFVIGFMGIFATSMSGAGIFSMLQAMGALRYKEEKQVAEVTQKKHDANKKS